MAALLGRYFAAVYGPVALWCFKGVPSSATPTVESTAWSPAPRTYDVVAVGLADQNTEQKSLFPPGGAVEVLTGNVSAAIVDSGSSQETVWIVDYYSSDCPHCWYLAPVITQLAEAYSVVLGPGGNYKGTSKVRVGACNCVEEGNRASCNEAAAYSYPKLLAYRLGGGSPLEVPTSFDGREASASDLATWIVAQDRELTPPNKSALRSGPDFGGELGGHTVLADAPPGLSGWPSEQILGEDRFHAARLGFTALLLNDYRAASQFEPALRLTGLMARAFPMHSRNLAILRGRLVSPDPDEFREIAKNWSQLFPPGNQSFCEVRTCLIWQMLHVLTASVAGILITHSRLYLQPEEVPEIGNVSVLETMSVIRETVATFLDCEACRDHFQQAWDRCDYGRCEVLGFQTEQDQAKAMVLWLWRLHNAVSLRVLAEHPPAAKLAPPDRRWPPFRDCPGCWRQEAVLGGDQGQNRSDSDSAEAVVAALDRVFDADRVFGYMLGAYLGRENLILEQPAVISDVVTPAADAGVGLRATAELPRLLPAARICLVIVACAVTGAILFMRARVGRVRQAGWGSSLEALE